MGGEAQAAKHRPQDSVLRAVVWLLLSPWALVLWLALAALLLRGTPAVAVPLGLVAAGAAVFFLIQRRRYGYTFLPHLYTYMLRPARQPVFVRAGNGRPRLAVIVPYRDRGPHLREFLAHVPRFLEAEGIDDYQIWIVDQAPGKPFSRAVLSNVGFLEAAKHGRDTFAFSDVDLIPVDRRRVTFSRVDHIRHLYGSHKALSSVWLTSEASFRKMNGYSNRFWGWGWQDQDALRRALAQGIRVEHGFSRFTGGFRELVSFWANNRERYRRIREHRRAIEVNRRIYDSQGAGEEAVRAQLARDGLTTCRYEVLERRVDEARRVHHIVVEI